MSEYITSDGDTIDYICWKHYGTPRNGMVETVMEANPGLANLGPVLGPGIRVTLPDISAPARTQLLIQLWD